MSDWNTISGSSWDSGTTGGDDDSWGAPKSAPKTATKNEWEAQTATASDDGEWGPGSKTPTQASVTGQTFEDIVCRTCTQPGHTARDCLDKAEGSAMTGECFNCGETGHIKADCPKPKVFKGSCHACGKEGHPAAECPDKPAPVCRNCKQEGHVTAECSNNHVFDREHLPTMEPLEAWLLVEKADRELNIDDFRVAVQTYAKAYNDLTYLNLEKCLRESNGNIHIIAVEAKLLKTQTLIDLQGKIDRTYQVTYQLSDMPNRARAAQYWPKDAAENQERLKNAGLPYDRGVPYCLRCKEIGHSSKKCPEAAILVDQVKIICVNCLEEGHRVRDCTKIRKGQGGPLTCRNCGQEGHKSDECTEPPDMDNVTCRKCDQTGHFAKDCPNEKCRNCDQPGHISKDCPEPRNPANVICRNCDEQGHFSKDCPKPRDYSRVECSNCHQMGHTKARCKEPANEETGGVPVTGASSLPSYDNSAPTENASANPDDAKADSDDCAVTDSSSEDGW